MTVKDQVTKLAFDALGTVGDTPAALIATREDLLAAVKELQMAAAELEQRALACWPDQRGYQLAVDGVGTFERGRKGNRYVWEDTPVGLATVRASMDRIDHPNDVVPAILRPASVGYWRTGVLDELGIEWKSMRRTILGQPCIRRPVG